MESDQEDDFHMTLVEEDEEWRYDEDEDEDDEGIMDEDEWNQYQELRREDMEEKKKQRRMLWEQQLKEEEEAEKIRSQMPQWIELTGPKGYFSIDEMPDSEWGALLRKEDQDDDESDLLHMAQWIRKRTTASAPPPPASVPPPPPPPPPPQVPAPPLVPVTPVWNQNTSKSGPKMDRRLAMEFPSIKDSMLPPSEKKTVEAPLPHRTLPTASYSSRHHQHQPSSSTPRHHHHRPPPVSLLTSQENPRPPLKRPTSLLTSSTPSLTPIVSTAPLSSGRGDNKTMDNSKLCKYYRDCRMNREKRCFMVHSLAEWTPRECRYHRCKSGVQCLYYHPSLMRKEDYMKGLFLHQDSVYAKNKSLYEKYLAK